MVGGEIRMYKLTNSKWGILRRLGRYREFVRDGKDDSYRDGDAAENDRGRLPDDEGVQIPAVWAVELYTPSQVARLTEGLRKLGWERGRSREDSLLQWTEKTRQGRSQSWASLGLVSDVRKPHLMSERTTSLPPGVDAAHPVLISLSPSITALVMGFFFTEEEAKSLDGPLRKIYSTYTSTSPLLRVRDVWAYIFFGRRARFTRTLHQPDNQRRDSVQNELARLEHTCANWITGNLPGVFASGIGGGDLPTAVLLVTEKIAPATDDFYPVRAFDGLSIRWLNERWISPQWPGAALNISEDSDYSKTRLKFICRRSDAFPASPGYNDPTSNWTIAHRAHETVRGILSRWALSRVLDGYSAELSALRDKSAGNGKYHALRDLKTLRSLVRHRLFDAAITAQEIEEFAGDPFSYRYDTLEMYVKDSNDKPHYLADALRRSQIADARRTLRDANLLQSVLSTTSNISQTISNLRIQQAVIGLTLVSIVIAAWALEVSIKAAH